MQSFKKVFPSFKKTPFKQEKLSICNYGELYESLFVFDQQRKQRSS